MHTQATPAHTPHGRGYEDSLLYFHHMNDYYDSTYENPSGICDGTMRPVDLWMSRSSDSYEGPAHGPFKRRLANAQAVGPGRLHGSRWMSSH